MKTILNNCFLSLLLMLSIVSSFRSMLSVHRPGSFKHVAKATFTTKFSQVKDKASINHSDIFKPKVLFILGGPGAGKGTQCEFLSSEFGMIHLSAGELLRNERASGSANGNLIESYLKEGKIVPVQITIDLLRQAMEKSGSNRYLIDGFPRNWDNIRGWEAAMEESCHVEGVLFLDCPEDILETRILGRGLTSGRSDDNIETIRKRFSTYKESTIPILEYYDQLKRLIRVRGDQDKSAVFGNLKTAVVPLIEKEVVAIQTYLLHPVSDWTQYARLCDAFVSTTVRKRSEMLQVNGLEEHRKALVNVDNGLHVSMAESKELTVTVSGKNATISRSFSVSGGIKSHETREWKIVDGYWKLMSVHIEER